jgi:hypothetical protein
MKLAMKINQRLGVLLSLFLLVFSSGVIIAHQCHTSAEITNAIAADHHGHAAETKAVAQMNTTAAESNSWRLIDSGCVAIIVIVLLVMRKYLLATSKRMFANWPRDLILKVQIRDFLIDRSFALSLPQLGIIRI